MDGSTEAADSAKMAGIVEQVRADLHLLPLEGSEKLLRERFGQAGLAVDDAEIGRIAREVQSGPSAVG
ncbi:hypothetical protein [Leifsonia xyli]|nr:hypothetical protein [Leifsonia xyli]